MASLINYASISVIIAIIILFFFGGTHYGIGIQDHIIDVVFLVIPYIVWYVFSSIVKPINPAIHAGYIGIILAFMLTAFNWVASLYGHYIVLPNYYLLASAFAASFSIGIFIVVKSRGS